MEKDKAVFVRLDEFKDILDIVALTRQKLDELKGVLGRIEEAKAREDASLEGWRTMLKDIEGRLEGVQAKLVQQ